MKTKVHNEIKVSVKTLLKTSAMTIEFNVRPLIGVQFTT